MNESPTYQELLAANRQLVAENELLRKENAKLSGLVKDLSEVDKETKNIGLMRNSPWTPSASWLTKISCCNGT